MIWRILPDWMFDAFIGVVLFLGVAVIWVVSIYAIITSVNYLIRVAA